MIKKAKSKAYWREYRRKYSYKYYYKNYAKVIACNRRYSKKNKKLLRFKERLTYARNPEKFRLKNRLYYYAKKADRQSGPIAQKLAYKIKMYERFSLRRTSRSESLKITRFYSKLIGKKTFTCCYCGIKHPVMHHHIDHVIPISKGGVHKASNLAICCKGCNLSKSNRLLSELSFYNGMFVKKSLLQKLKNGRV